MKEIVAQPSAEAERTRVRSVKCIAAINEAFHALMAADSRIVMMGEDILDPYGGAFKATKGLSSKYASRVFTTPISESAIVGIGAGLAMRGYRPIVEIMFGDFLSLAFDQLLNSATKFHEMYNGQTDCPLIVRTPMGGRRGYGPTHSQTLDKYFCGIPGIKLIAPTQYHSICDLYGAALNDSGVKLVIENKVMYGKDVATPVNGRVEEFFVRSSQSDYPVLEFSLNNFSRADVTILCYGGMVEPALAAALSAYLEEELAVEVIAPSLISPFDCSMLSRSVRSSRKLIIVEEGTEPWGIAAEWGFQAQQDFFGVLASPVHRLAAKSPIIPSSKGAEADALVQTHDILEAIIALTR